MKTWTDTSYVLEDHEHLNVTTHTQAISLHLPGYTGDGRGFSVRFLPAHLPRLRELVSALETLTRQMEHTDHSPFQHDGTCPACQRDAALEDARQDADAERYADVAPIVAPRDVF